MDAFFSILQILSSNPLVVGIVLFFIGKHYWLDKYLMSKQTSNDFNEKQIIMSRIYLLKRRFQSVEKRYNKLIDAETAARRRGTQLSGEYESTELNKIDQITHGEILESISKIEGRIKIYFHDNENVDTCLTKYLKSCEEFQNFWILEFPDGNDLSKRTTESEEFKALLDDFNKNEGELIKTIMKEHSIWWSGTKSN